MINYLQKRNFLFTSFLHILFFISISIQSFSQEAVNPEAVKAGEALFNADCKICHRVKEKLIGPALQGVEERAPSKEWIIKWVRNSSKVIASGDEYAVKLYTEYNKQQMTSFSNYKDEDVLNILAYVNDEANKVEQVVASSPTDAGGSSVNEGVESYLRVIMVGMLFIFVLLIIILVLIINTVKKFLITQNLTAEDKEEVTSPITLSSFTSSTGFIFVVLFLVGSITVKTVIDGLFSIGVQKDYAPKQPIAFSHKIHAGDLAINCQYCHTGVNIGKQANIPSANICMNCHAQVKSGKIAGTTEIEKIYVAAGFDPTTASYSGNVKPVEWVRVHNLPDLAYFNHSQHVNVGNVACQTCHGPVETMEVVGQYSLLTMGWCIDCHRKTSVNAKGNAYYDKLLELHDSKHSMKVEDIGGLECSKCHY